jgi:hypothetical protein
MVWLMVWFLLSTMGGYGARDSQPWLVPAVVASLFPMAFSWCGFGRMKKSFI